MSQLLISIVGFLVAIGILVSIHEFGHFWVARRFGIKVLRFSIGFGRPFFRWYDKHGTEYVLSCIPLGGYVSLFGERGNGVNETEREFSFSHKPVGVRIAVLFAGPLFNFLFAIFAYWLMFVIGISYVAPILGNVPVKTAAYQAGLHKNQEIISINGKTTSSWGAVTIALIANSSKEQVEVTVREGEKGNIETHHLNLSALEDSVQNEDILKELGLNGVDPYPPIVKDLMPNSPAELAGIKKGDRLIAIDGKPIQTRTDANDLIRPELNKTINLRILRDQSEQDFSIKTMVKNNEDGKPMGVIGVIYDTDVKPPQEWMRVLQYNPLEALLEAAQKTWEHSILTIEMLGKMIVGKASLKNISGPITIAQYAGHTVQIGFEHFLSFLAIVSISLGVLNLLPIPLLDGGHIFYCLWELVTGRPVSEHIQNIGFIMGGILIIFIMLLGLYNDILRF